MQAIDRIIGILEAVTERPDGATATEVADATELSLSTATRLLHQMTARGLVVRANGDRRYVLGPLLFSVVRRGTAQLDVTAMIRPILQRVRDATEETASLHVRRGDSRVCIAAVASRQPIARQVPVGTAMPLHRNATGEVLLAGAPPEERDRYVAGLRLPPHEEAELQRRLEAIRREGWAVVADDWVPGVTGISAAVTEGETTLAALSVSGPAARLGADTARGHLPVLREAAGELAQWAALGGL